MEKDIFFYEVTDSDLKLKSSVKDINIEIYVLLPNGYSKKYNFLRVVLFTNAIKKEINKQKNNLTIKQLFFGLLRNLPGDIFKYPMVSLIVGEDKISISDGELMEYCNSKTNERILSSSCVIDINDETTVYKDYNYYVSDKNKYACFCDILTNPYCVYPEDGLPNGQEEAYSMYAKGIINGFNTEIVECNKRKKKK